MGEITRLLAGSDGDRPDLDAVFEHVYPELKRLAHASISRLGRGQTLTPTALVSEAYVKMVQAESLEMTGKRHFFACAARAMRHIIIDHIRAAMADKRGGDQISITLSDEHLSLADSPRQLLDLDRVLDELGQMSPRQLELVEMKFFAGLPMRQISQLIGLPERSTWREWERAKAYLHARLKDV